MLTLLKYECCKHGEVLLTDTCGGDAGVVLGRLWDVKRRWLDVSDLWPRGQRKELKKLHEIEYLLGFRIDLDLHYKWYTNVILKYKLTFILGTGNNLEQL